MARALLSSSQTSGRLTRLRWLASALAACWILHGPATSLHAVPIPGAVLWFDASDVNGDGSNPADGAPISTWVDKAPGQGLQNLTQGGTAAQPTYLANAQNGRGAVSFSGGGGGIGAGQWLAGPNLSLGTFTLLTVLKTSDTSVRLIWEHSPNVNGNDGAYLNATANWSIRVDRGAAISAKDTTPANWSNSPNLLSATMTYGGDHASHLFTINGSAPTLTTTQGGNPGTNVITQPFFLGARSGGSIGITGEIAEFIIYDSALNQASRNILDNYLSAKYATPLAAAVDFYQGDEAANGNFDFAVFGIGREADGTVSTGTFGSGLALTEANSSLSIGDYLLAGHNGAAATLTGGVLDRVWYLDKTGSLDATLTFDLEELNITLDESDTVSLLYRDSLAGSFTQLSVMGDITGSQVSFLLENSLLLNGHYTLGVAQAIIPEPSTLLLGAGTFGLVLGRRRNRKRA